MTEKDLDVAIEKCERIMEMDTRTMQNPVSENGWIFEKVYDLLQYLRQFQFATDINVATTDTISRQAAIKAVRTAKGKGEAHRMLIQLPSAQKYGMWIVRYFGADAKCSECGMYCVGAYDHDRCDQYCRCCGAKMDGLKLEGDRNEQFKVSDL